MVKVKILSGNQAGAVVEMAQGEAESNVATGFAAYVTEDPVQDVDPAPDPHPKRKAKKGEDD